jgi:hypothetical protein
MLFIGSFVRWISLSTKKGVQGHPLAAEAAIERRRIAPVIRALLRNVDPLFRAAGLMVG